MDVFSRTFLPSAAEAGIAISTTSRHMPVLRRCIEPDDATMMVTRCLCPDRPLRGEFLLVLTDRRLVVTQETRVLRRLRLHLNTELRHLGNVTWSPDPRLPAVELAATAIDGVRERFWIRAGHRDRVYQVESLLNRAFTCRTMPAPAHPAVATVRPEAVARPDATIRLTGVPVARAA